MAISLLKLETGGRSLEFSPADLDQVKAALETLFGSPEVVRGIGYVMLRFKQGDLLFQNEWDEPCLIASGILESEMLEVVATSLGARS